MLKCASFFAGVGGIDLGFEKTNQFETIYANEFDKYAAATYNINSKIDIDCRDIKDIKASEIPDFDVMLAGFPCQAFSVAGHGEGFEDKKGRGTLFFELVRIFKAKQPQILFFENVKNLLTHDSGKTFETIMNELEKENYHVKYAVLNAMHFGNVPQNRERIYIVAFKDKSNFEKFDFPEQIPLDKTIFDIINFNDKQEEKYYYTAGKFRSNIYEQLVESMDDENAIYQYRRQYVRKNKSGVVPTLTANQGEGGHNVCLIKTKHGIRKMLPRECFNAQGFPDDFKFPNGMPDSKLYKQAGNSVCVPVIERIAENIIKAIK